MGNASIGCPGMWWPREAITHSCHILLDSQQMTMTHTSQTTGKMFAVKFCEIDLKWRKSVACFGIVLANNKSFFIADVITNWKLQWELGWGLFWDSCVSVCICVSSLAHDFHLRGSLVYLLIGNINLSDFVWIQAHYIRLDSFVEDLGGGDLFLL